MDNKLVGAKLSDNRDLSSDEYFKKLIEELADNNILTEKELENILCRRMELLKERLTYYTRNESSSISEEEAENILEGIDYTMGLYFKALDIEKSIDVLRKSELNNSLKEGEKIIKAKFEKNKVLFNILGRVLCGKTLKGLFLNNNDILQVQNDLSNLSKDEVTLRLMKAFKEGMTQLNIENKELIDYGALLIGKEIDYVYMNISENTLQNIFVIYKQKEERKKIRYTDGNKLKDSKFREYTKMIRDRKSMNEKLEIIINNFKSLNDIVDMLESECLFGEEYEVFFRSIPEIYKVLLLKYMDIQYSDGECDEEWCVSLKKYICNLSKEEQDYYRDKIDKIDCEV